MKKEEAKEILEIVNFIKDKMATSEELAAVEKKLSARIDRVEKELGDRITGVESKLASIDRRLDDEAMRRQHHNLPNCVAHLSVPLNERRTRLERSLIPK